MRSQKYVLINTSISDLNAASVGFSIFTDTELKFKSTEKVYKVYVLLKLLLKQYKIHCKTFKQYRRV